MKKLILAILTAALMAVMLVPTLAADKPIADKGYAGQTKTDKGMNTGARTASNFTKRTLTVPQKHHKSRHKPGNRKHSTLVRGSKHSVRKMDKFVHKTLTPEKK